jgi:RecA-family ATPase
MPSIPPIGVRFIDDVPPHPPELIPGFLPADGVTLISGPTNIGKSLLAIEVASALTTGSPLWGHLPVHHKIKRVAYVLGEHTASTVHRLFKVTGLPMGRDARIIGPEHLPVNRHLVVKGEPQSEAIEHYEKLVAGSELIIVDPLSAFIAGANAESDNTAMRNLVDQFQWLGIQNHAPALMLGHFGKPTKQKDGSEEHRTSYASRGASSAEDACPSVFYLNEEVGQSFRLTCRKYKGQTPPKRILLRNEATKVHTLLVSKRPTIEAQRIQFRNRVQVVTAKGVDKTAAVTSVAALDGLSMSTAWRYMSEKDLTLVKGVGVGA